MIISRGTALAACVLVLGVPLALFASSEDPVVVGIPAADGVGDEALTLSACVENAILGNADLEAERLRRGELRGQGWQAMSTALPSVDLSGNWSRGRDPSFLLDESFGGGSDSLELPPGIPSPEDLEAQSFWRGSVGSDWEINPFRIVNAISAVRISQRQHDQDLRSAEHTVVERTMATFYEISRHHERLASIEAEIEARREFLDLTRRRFELDLATELDTLRAAVSLANLKPSARRASKDLRNAGSRLNILMGRGAMEPLALLPVLDVELDPIDLEWVMERALSRPDLRSLELEIEFLDRQKGVLRSDQRPYLSMSGNYGYVARTATDLFEGQFDSWGASVALVIPLFDGFYTKGRVDETKARIERTEEFLVQARREARLEVATAVEELAAARENLEAAELNLRAAESALEQMSLRYELGRAEYLDLLNSQSNRFAARSNRIEARFEVLATTATLKRAVGIHPTESLSRMQETVERTDP